MLWIMTMGRRLNGIYTAVSVVTRGGDRASKRRVMLRDKRHFAWY